MLASHETAYFRGFAIQGGTEPSIPVAEDIQCDDASEAETLRLIKAAERSDPISDHAIALCTAPESVGERRSEILAAVAVDMDEYDS